uniref:Uncharacterized protein n=1 Tax=viral metagenome TaxID=1070528 RepID=A0A6C0ADT7_9ZZZZ
MLLKFFNFFIIIIIKNILIKKFKLFTTPLQMN